MQNQALKSQGMEKVEQNKANFLSLGFSQSQLPPFGRRCFQFTKWWEDGDGERAGTTAASKLLGLTRSVWHTQPKDCAPLICLSPHCFGDICRRADEWEDQADGSLLGQLHIEPKRISFELQWLK